MSYDIITRSINGLNDPALTLIAQVIDSDFIFTLMVLGLLMLEKDGTKRKKVFVALLAAFLLTVALKSAFHIQRPCTELLAKIPCPMGYAFPSAHAMVAFTLAVAFLYRPNYWAYLGFALIVAASRIYLGVHSLEDVAGSLALSVILYNSIDHVWRKYHEK